MKIVCLDFEGVLIPDIWPIVAQKTGVAQLNLTTREVKDYRELMEKRVGICKDHHITLKDIQTIIATIDPLPGALEFVSWIKEHYQFILLSDTFYEFAEHFLRLFQWPTLFGHSIQYNESKQQIEFFLRQDNQKQKAVEALKSLNFKVFAAGDSYNDTTMLAAAHGASLFCAPPQVVQEFPQFPHVKDYDALKKEIVKVLG
jgi:phosphoserine / homoserine phosphotransferase